MNETNHLIVDASGPVARVTLNRPGIHNAFDDALVASLAETAAALGGDDAVRVVVLAGAGTSFCAGADLNWMRRVVGYSARENARDSREMALMFEAWNALPKPVIGRIHGAALGGGVGLVSVCDIAIASTDALFGLTEVRLGILPAVISPFVLAKIGPAAARELFLTGERIGAERARRIGLVQRVVAPADLDADVQATVTRLLAGGPRALAEAKRIVAEVSGLRPEQARETTTAAIARARTGPEGQEGMRAFLERRPPSWREGE
jgi:methylglutaconyl-CoA hydratase